MMRSESIIIIWGIPKKHNFIMKKVLMETKNFNTSLKEGEFKN